MGAHRRRRRPGRRGQGAGLSAPDLRGTRACRVQPDVVAVRRAFDYLVPDELAPRVRVGTVVRVPLHGRRVRGWVLDAELAPGDVDAPTGRLLPVDAVVSAGPPASLVEVCRWAAWRWAGPLAVFLRTATPPNVVGAAEEPEPGAAVYPARLEPDHPWAGDALIVHAPSAAPSVRPLLAPEGSTLVLHPAAAEVGRIAAALRDDGRDVVVLSSEHRAADLTRAWDRARSGACVVVGGRIAAWAPVPDLATVIVVDESDEALEDERAPTWNARDVALERARRAGATIRMITPAPSLEAIQALGQPVAHTAARWPRVEVVDVRDQEPGQALLTRELAEALRRTIGAGRRAVCVLNRKGRARLLACRSCRELARCERCGATVAETDDVLRCAVCDAARPRVCLHCHATRFRPVRPGVARVRDDLAALLPRVDVGVVEAATVDLPDAPVLVGTEAVLHRIDPATPPVGLVAFLELDQELLAPRLRAAEQALWLLVRGARLLESRTVAGAGTLLLQTRLPEHEVVQAVERGDPLLVARAERSRREPLGFPPFGGLAELSGEAVAVEAACAALREQRSVGAAPMTVLGPVAEGTAGGRLRALVRAASWPALCDALARPDVDAAHALGRLRVDVDPRRV